LTTVSGRSITRQIDGTSQGVVLNATSVLPKPQQIPLMSHAFLCPEINICDLEQDLKSKIQTQRQEKKKETYMLIRAVTVEKTTSKTSNTYAGEIHADL
jgi:hypothetical protein